MLCWSAEADVSMSWWFFSLVSCTFAVQFWQKSKKSVKKKNTQQSNAQEEKNSSRIIKQKPLTLDWELSWVRVEELRVEKNAF